MENKTYTCYAIQNKKNLKLYVGSTGNLEQRISTHFSKLKNGSHHNYAFQKEYSDLVLSAADFDVFCLETDIPPELRYKKEAGYILSLNANTELGGYNSNDSVVLNFMKKKPKIIYGIPEIKKIE